MRFVKKSLGVNSVNNSLSVNHESNDRRSTPNLEAAESNMATPNDVQELSSSNINVLHKLQSLDKLQCTL